MRKTAFFVLLFILMAAGVGKSVATYAADTSPTTLTNVQERVNRTPVSADDGERIARDYLQANVASLGVSESDLSGLRVTDSIVLRSSGARVVYFQQTVNGIGVFNGVVNVTILPDGKVLNVGNRAASNVQASLNSQTPTLTPAQAVASAAAGLGLSYKADSVTQLESLGGSEQETRFNGGNLSSEVIPVKLAYTPMDDGSLRLSWDMNIYEPNGLHWWHVRVDAATGEVLNKIDWVVNENFDELIESGTVEYNTYHPVSIGTESPLHFGVADGSSYKVYALPVESPNHTSPLPPADARTTINEPAHTTASPYGWHDTNGAAGAEFTITRGNNVWAGMDVASPNGIDAGSEASGGAGLDFLAAINLAGAPSTYRPAAATNLFVWNNYMHDIPYIYGFDEQAGNFQSNNYGRGGLGNDYVLAEGQDYSGTNNANFATPPDGSLPRMQMYVGTTPNPDVDGDLDNGVIAHEYGHGISNRLTGGPANASCLGNQEQAGEGWSDWQGMSLTMKPGDTGPQARGMGTYLFGQAPNGPGIRPAPYSTNMSVNNYTYNNRTGVAVPHGVGFLWASMVWEVNWNLIGVYGFNPDIYGAWNTGGNNLTYQLVQDGMAIQPCSPGFVDGRNAILSADTALTGGANQCLIWAGFAKRGLGYSATQGSSNSLSDGAGAFDMPPSCSGATATPVPPTVTRTPSSVPPTGVPPTVTRTPSSVPPTPTGVPPTVTRTPSSVPPTTTPVPPTATPPTGGTIVNGNFEAVPITGWTESSGNGYSLIGAYTPYQGTRNTWLCGYNNCVDQISQTITVPAGGATLYYRYRITSTDWCGWDYGYVQVGTTNIVTHNLCTTTQSSTYVQGSVSLNAYAGQSISLRFRSTTDSSYVSSFRVDNVGYTPSFVEGVQEPAPVSVAPDYREAKPAVPGPDANKSER